MISLWWRHQITSLIWRQQNDVTIFPFSSPSPPL